MHEAGILLDNWVLYQLRLITLLGCPGKGFTLNFFFLRYPEAMNSGYEDREGNDEKTYIF